MVGAQDAGEHIQGAAEGEEAEKEHERRFRSRAAIVVGVLAMLLTIASLGGDEAASQIVNNNILASDTYAFYQAKNIRQTDHRLAMDDLQAMLASHGAGLTDDARRAIERTLADYQATIDRLESEPDPNDPTNPLKGEGKKELLGRARQHEADRDHAQRQGLNLDYSTSLYQIAIVLGSVAIVATSRPILWLALALGAVATLLMLNGFFLFFDLPIA